MTKPENRREIESYSLERTMIVTSDRLEAVDNAASEVTELLKEGVQVISEAPEFHYTKIAEMKIEMIGEASKDARRRADEVARNAGFRVTDVHHARIGIFQITRPHSTEVSDYGLHDSTSIEKDVRAVVGLTVGVASN